MRICILTTSYPRSSSDDAGIFIKRLVEAFGANGACGNVVVPLDKSEACAETDGAFHVSRFRYGVFSKGRLAFGAGIMPNLRKNPFLLLQAPALLLMMALRAYRFRKESDIFHANWISSGIAACLCALLCRKPFVITLRGEDMKLLKVSALRPLFKFILKRAAAITSVNESFLKQLAEGFPECTRKLHYIPNGVDAKLPDEASLCAFAQAHGLDSSSKYLLYTGRVIKLKRLEKLIQLIALPEMKDFKLILCGSSEDSNYQKELEDLTAELGCQNRVHFSGRVAPTEVVYYLGLSLFYISASSYEGRSNSILEAMAAGKLVFASNIPGHAELIKDRQTGILFEPDRLEELAQNILLIEKSADLREEIIQRAKEKLKENSWHNCAANYLRIFEMVI